MRSHPLISASVLALLLTFSNSLANARQVVISQILGQGVEVLKKGKSKWSFAAGGQALEAGDKIRTNKKARATLLSKEGHKILVKQETVFQISKLGPVEWEFNEEVGRVRLKVSKLEGSQSLKVKTPTAVCSVRGTDYQVNTLPDGQTIVDVYDGVVGISNGRDAEIPVLENQRSVISQEGAQPTPPEKIPENEKPQDPGFTRRGPETGQPGLAGPGPMDEKQRAQMQNLQQQLAQLDPNDREGQEKIKGEMKSFMKERFEDGMKDFKGSKEERARMEENFKSHMERFDKEGIEEQGNMRDRGMGPGPGPFGMESGMGPMGEERGWDPGMEKGEMISQMKEGFDQFMKDFKGTPEERQMFEQAFHSEIEHFEKDEFGPGMGGPFGPPNGDSAYDRRADERADIKDRRGDERRFEGGKEEDRGRWEDRYRDDEFRNEIANEVNHDYRQDQYQESVKDELRVELIQTSKELIDSSGRRVRLEENVLRPAPDSFKFVSLSKRADREDSVVFEVVANRPLPENLEEAGNLWFHDGSSKPQWYVLKQKLSITNGADENSGRDRIVQLFLDGDSKEVFTANSFYQDGNYVTTVSRSFQTIFDHRYEFINADPASLNNVWAGSSRPSNLTGMMWHMRPVLQEMYIPSRSTVIEYFWNYAFVTTSGSGDTATGKMMITQFTPGSGPTLAHFVKRQSYINFVDANQNGRLDQGETYRDFNGNKTRDNDEPFLDAVQVGLNGTRDNAREFSSNGDTNFFSDINRDGLNNDNVSGTDPFSVISRPWAFLKEDMFLIDDFGKIQDFSQIGTPSSPEAMADLFEKLNMERSFTSSEFGGRDINAIMSPRMFMKAKLLEFKLDGNEDLYDRR